MPERPNSTRLEWPRSQAGLDRLLTQLDDRRGQLVREIREQRGSRSTPTGTRRQRILDATGGRCHICGGRIRGDRFVIDHVASFATGGASATSNYLPAHRSCNGYKWFYLPAELRWMLRMGVWARHRMTDGTKFGDDIRIDFWKWEQRRRKRSTNQD